MNGGDMVFGFLLGLVAAALLCLTVEGYDYKTPAIEAGCAQYNPQTGEFEWLNKK